MLEQGTITVHTENIFPIIKKSLYSERDIFLRELISNAFDAISKLKMLSYAGEFQATDETYAVQVNLDKEGRLLRISDNGIGMTAEEIKKYINQIAFSSAEEFVNKFAKSDENQIIGHFGLGFYSAFMVADRVEIDTLSYRPGSTAARWSCDGTTSFTLDTSSRSERGTSITLYLSQDAEEFLNELELKNIIRKYCDFLPIPIYFGEETANKQTPLWKQSPSSLKDEDYLEFYRYLYPFKGDPLFWIHLNTDYPFLLQGILYFPKIERDMDLTKGQIKLFCNQVFVSDNTEEIIPRFLTPLQGAIDSPDIPLNVSRSYLQGDRTVRRISDFITKKVADRLKDMYTNQRETYLKCWPDISVFVKFGMMNNDKFFEQAKDLLIFPTAQTGKPAEDAIPPYKTIAEYQEANKAKTEQKVYYTTDVVNQSSYIDLLLAQNIEVLILDSFIDTHFVQFLEGKYPEVRFSRVDADLDENLLTQDKAAELVDPRTQKTRSEVLKDLFKSVLNLPKLNVRTEALKSEAVPAVVLLPEQLRRLKEMTAMMQQKNMDFLDEHTLLLNTSNPLVQNLQKLEDSGKDPDLVALLCRQVYDLALMSQKPFDADSLQSFIQRSNTVMAQLAATRASI
ncbi:molecular chaperone HtpG [Anthocerotibacter panamensis]|uniref:molecular chaperone HtpG n=1 Tax=Anthocerotibacter panamensis TaxID=2857077 RepID=UPI001C407BA7